ncbi:MAG: hypothetical protein JWO36_3586 [Myxococcales bacterium]|nr:hypothetical protein [Myxococcales bacterium]
MKLAINLLLSFGMLALCLWLIWPDHETREQVSNALGSLDMSAFAPYLVGYVALLIVMHLCRSLRWNNLLAPLGVKIPAGPLLAISSVGFMAILALPARLGEFVRPGLLRKRGISASAALGTVAVERIVDGLLISLFVFCAFFSLRGPASPRWMMATAYAALAVFTVALVGLLFALRWPEKTVKFFARLTLVPLISPRLGAALERKGLEMVRGFDALRDRKNMLAFLAWSVVYWGANGLGVYVLAHGFAAASPTAHAVGFDISVIAAFATMGLVAVGITLPNSPGLVGQFQWFTLLGLSLYLGVDAKTKGTPLYGMTFAFANLHYLTQVLWYVGMGLVGLASPWVSLHDLWTARKTGTEDPK